VTRINGRAALLTTSALVILLIGACSQPAANAAKPVVTTTGSASGAATTPVTTASTPTPAPRATTTKPPAPQTAAPAHFTTKPPGSTLPSDAQCAAWVRPTTYPENKGVNKTANNTKGQSIGTSFFNGDAPQANSAIAPRVDGQFTGTTHQILRWAACKWGIDEDMVYAQAAVESWWRQTTLGDWGTDATRCAPGHGLGADGQAGTCPESWGILQNRYPYEQSSWPGIATSTAMNADLAYAIWRTCFDGYETWLNTVDQGQHYAAGDAWGCIGRWFAGRWHTQPAEDYITKVKSYLAQRIWTTANFQEP
jgi:autotransporter family porin